MSTLWWEGGGGLAVLYLRGALIAEVVWDAVQCQRRLWSPMTEKAAWLVCNCLNLPDKVPDCDLPSAFSRDVRGQGRGSFGTEMTLCAWVYGYGVWHMGRKKKNLKL